jgi:dihydroneopterin aldolase
MAALIETPICADPARSTQPRWPDAGFDATVEVTVSGLQVAADIGVYAHEHGNPQPLVIDIAIRVTPPTEDRLEASIDYQSVADAAHALGRERIQLIETYARRLALACLDHPAAQAVEVRVGKAGALRAGLAGTRVTLARR